MRFCLGEWEGKWRTWIWNMNLWVYLPIRGLFRPTWIACGFIGLNPRVQRDLLGYVPGKIILTELIMTTNSSFHSTEANTINSELNVLVNLSDSFSNKLPFGERIWTKPIVCCSILKLRISKDKLSWCQQTRLLTILIPVLSFHLLIAKWITKAQSLSVSHLKNR